MHACRLLRLFADADKIRPQKRIDAGDADENNLRSFLRHFDNFFYCFRDFLKVAPGHKIRLIHFKIKHPLTVAASPAQNRTVPSAAARRYEQHDGFRYHQTCPFDAETVSSRRIIGKCRR